MEKSLKIRKISCRELLGWLFIGISLIMLGNSLRLCASSDIWYDELFTVGMVEHSYGELIGFTARDVHPPLYYFIAKFVLDLCKLIVPSADSVMIVKIVSVMPYFLLLAYALTFLRKSFGIFVSGIFMFCVLAMPQMSAYTVEMRMYGWALFFVTATFFHAYDVVCGCAYTRVCGVWERENSIDIRAEKEDADCRDGIEIEDCIGNEGLPDGVLQDSGLCDRELQDSRLQNYELQNDKNKKYENCRDGISSSVSWHSGNIKNYVAILLYGLAAAYTQYFACVAVIMVYLCLLVWILICYKRSCKGKYNISTALPALKGWIVCAALSIIGYLPWLFILMSQINTIRGNYWILPLTWRNLGGCVKFIMKPAFQNEQINVILAVCLFVIYVSLLLAYGLSVRKTRHTNNATFFYTISSCLVLCGLIAFGFIASIIIRPIFVYRYMMPALGCFWLCFALCLDYLYKNNRPYRGESKAGKAVYYLFMPYIYIVIIILAVGIRDYSAFMGEEEYRAVLMEETAQAISDIDKNDIILYNFDQLQAVCGYYMNQENYLWNGEPEQLIVDMFGNKGSIEGTQQIKQWLDNGRTLWFFGSFNSREDIREEWAKDGIATDETGSYMLERYWFNIYKVSSASYRE